MSETANQSGIFNMENKMKLEPKEFIARYLHYLPWVLVSIVLFLLLAYIKIRYAVPIYHVQSSLLIKSDDQMGLGGGGGGSQQDQRFDNLFLNAGNINLSNETEILRSRPVLKRVARDLGLQLTQHSKGSIRSSLMYDYLAFRCEVQKVADSSRSFAFQVNVLDDNGFQIDEQKTTIAFGQPFQVGKNVCVLWRNKEMGLRLFPIRLFEVAWNPMADVAEGLMSGLTVTQINDQATILTLSYEGENMNLNKDVLNTLMEVYDSLNVEDKSKISVASLRFIDDRLNSLKIELAEIEGRMKNFMVSNQVYDIDDQSKAYLDNLSTEAKDRSDQEIRLNVVNWLLEYIQNEKNLYHVVPTNLGIDEPTLLQLVSEYNRMQIQREANLETSTPNNPIIISLNTSLDKIRQSIHQALQNVRQGYLIAGKKLQQQEEQLQGNIRTLPGKSMQFINISRQQKILEDLYSFLLQKKIEISISSASTISNSKVIEPAIGSARPISPNKKSIYLMHLILGIALPAGIIALIELLRDKVRNRADVEKHITAPILGEIGHSSNDQPLVVTSNNRHFIGEQFRIIRTNLQYIIAKKEKPVIMVTSSFSGEGKSFISTNIAAVMAIAGKKTVILEFDIRKPKIISGLDLKRKMGITNYIIGKASFDDMLLKVDGVENLYVIPCGPIPPNPSELLLDPLLDELMKEACERFDIVIMDTAPIGLVSDAMNLGKYADCTLYIVRQGHTFRRQLDMIENLYQENKIPKMAILLNDAKPEGGYYGGYGYGYYGGYSYGLRSGYFESDSDIKGSFFRRTLRRLKKMLFK